MNKAELTHAKSIARHILMHIGQLKVDMQGIERMTEADIRGYSTSAMKAQIRGDVDHAIREMQQVLDDMLDGLDNQN